MTDSKGNVIGYFPIELLEITRIEGVELEHPGNYITLKDFGGQHYNLGKQVSLNFGREVYRI